MALADRNPKAKPPGKPCSVNALLTTMPGDDATALTTWLNDVTVTESGIWQALASEGYTCSRQQIGRHRRRECRCYAAG